MTTKKIGKGQTLMYGLISVFLIAVIAIFGMVLLVSHGPALP